MSALQKMHCRHCRQTFLTGAGAERCDLCGKSGGLISPEAALQEKAAQEQHRAELSKRPAKQLTTRQSLGSLLALPTILGAWNLWTRSPEFGSYTWAFDMGCIAFGVVGSLVLALWPKAKEPSGSEGEKAS